MAIISDVHCSGERCSRQREFVAWLDSLTADALWLLGDVFHAGWDFRPREQPEYVHVLEALERLASRGTGIVFVPGNHDFGMSDLLKERLGAEVVGPHVREIDDRRVFLAHGDEADGSMRYRLVRAVLRSSVFDVAVRGLGVRLGTKVLRTLAGDSSPHGEVWPSTKQWLMSQLEHADIAIIGHVHTPWSEGGAVTLAPGVRGARWLIDGQLTERPD